MSSEQVTLDPDLDAPIKDADEMASIVGLTTSQFYYHTGKGRFDVSWLGNRMISTKRRLLKSIGALPSSNVA